MAWKGKFFGALIGLFLTPADLGRGRRRPHRASVRRGRARRDTRRGPRGSAPASVSEVFFRTTFELMGHVAKSDGHVSEAEIGAARG